MHATNPVAFASALICSPLDDLRSAFFANPTDNDQVMLNPKRRTALDFDPNIITFALHETRLLAGSAQNTISVYSTEDLFTGQGSLHALHVFQSISSSAPASILPNPGDTSELIAVLWQAGGASSTSVVEVVLDMLT